MKKLFILISLICNLAYGQQTKNANIPIEQPLIYNFDLTVNRGFSIVNTQGWGLLTLYHDVTDANDSVTSLVLTCRSSRTEGDFIYTIANSANCAGDVMTVMQNGTAYALTEGVDWNRGASNAAAASSLNTAIHALAYVDAVYSNATSTIKRLPTLTSLWAYSSDATCATVALGNNLAAIQDCDMGLGNCTSYNARWTATNAANQPLAATALKAWPWRIDIENFTEMHCTYVPTGGAAADKLYVYGRFAVK